MANSPSTNNADFGAKLTELEAITVWFESSEVDLNEALKKFERGMQLADELKRELHQVENRVEKIRAKFDGPTNTVVDSEEAEPTPMGGDSPSLF